METAAKRGGGEERRERGLLARRHHGRDHQEADLEAPLQVRERLGRGAAALASASSRRALGAAWDLGGGLGGAEVGGRRGLAAGVSSARGGQSGRGDPGCRADATGGGQAGRRRGGDPGAFTSLVALAVPHLAPALASLAGRVCLHS